MQEIHTFSLVSALWWHDNGTIHTLLKKSYGIKRWGGGCLFFTPSLFNMSHSHVFPFLSLHNSSHHHVLSCLDKFNGDFSRSLWPAVAVAPSSVCTRHFHRQLNLIRVANTQLITLTLISCIMHRKKILVKPLLCVCMYHWTAFTEFRLHDKALNYIGTLCFL